MTALPHPELGQITQKDLDGLVDAYNNLDSMVTRVRELHKPFTEFDQVWCSHCIQDTLEEDLNRLHYPCPTIRTLDGETK